MLPRVLPELVDHNFEIGSELRVILLVLGGCLYSEQHECCARTYRITPLASKMSTTPRNPATADLRGGNASELFSNNFRVVLSPIHASAPTLLAIWAGVNSSLANWTPAATGLSLDVDSLTFCSGRDNVVDCWACAGICGSDARGELGCGDGATDDG